MELGALLVGVAILVMAGIALADPWVRGRSQLRWAQEGTVSPAPASGDKRAILHALRDLDFDFQTGKINEPDYRALRATLLAEAASALEADGEGRASSEARSGSRLRAEGTAPLETRSCPKCGWMVGREHRYCAQCGDPITQLCQACRLPVHAGDQFCSSCG